MSTSDIITSLTQENETLKSALSTTRKLLAAWERGEVPPADPKMPYYVDQAWLDSAPESNGPGVGVRQAVTPFMYAIMSPDGAPYFDEHCVDSHESGLWEEVNGLNDSPDTGYKVVGLYLAYAPQQAGALTDDEIMDIAEPFHDINGVLFDEVSFAREILALAKGGA